MENIQYISKAWLVSCFSGKSWFKSRAQHIHILGLSSKPSKQEGALSLHLLPFPIRYLYGYTIFHQCRVQVCVRDFKALISGSDHGAQDLKLSLEDLNQLERNLLTEVLLWVVAETSLGGKGEPAAVSTCNATFCQRLVHWRSCKLQSAFLWFLRNSQSPTTACWAATWWPSPGRWCWRQGASAAWCPRWSSPWRSAGVVAGRWGCWASSRRSRTVGCRGRLL